MKEYIERDKVLDQAYYHLLYRESIYDEYGVDAVDEDDIKTIPAADVVEVRHGRWIKDDYTGEPICSVCHSGKPTKCVLSSEVQHTLGNHEIRYCYYCGAKMDGGVNDG